MISMILESALRSLALGAAVWIALKCFRVTNPEARKLAWILVLLGSLAMPGLMQWTTLPVEAQPAIVTHSIPAVAYARVSQIAQTPVWNWKQVLLPLYLSVSFLLLLRLALGLSIAMRLWRLAQSSALFPDVRISGGTAAPVAIGSGVLLPVTSLNWDADRLRIVLAHERTHVRNGDFYWQLLAGFHASLFWFNPLAWWLKKELIEAAEAVSDAAALREAGSATSYAELLLDFAAGPQGFVAGVAMASSDVRRRIDTLLTACSPLQEFSWKRGALLFVTLAPILIVAAGVNVHLKAQPSTTHHKEAYVIVSGASDDSITMNGSNGDEELARALRSKVSGAFVWFVRNGKAYYVDDPAWVKRAQDLLKPQEDLGREQEKLGEQQEKLGEEQARLGELQERVSVKLPAIDKSLADLQAQLKSAKPEITQAELSEFQEKISELQSKLGEAQELAGEKQSEFGVQQSKLGDQQGELGAKQAELGEKQAKIAEEADRKIHSMIDQALRDGKAHPAQ